MSNQFQRKCGKNLWKNRFPTWNRPIRSLERKCTSISIIPIKSYQILIIPITVAYKSHYISRNPKWLWGWWPPMNPSAPASACDLAELLRACAPLAPPRGGDKLQATPWMTAWGWELMAQYWGVSITHRIHGAGIYANIGGILMVNVTIYSIHGSYG